MKEYTIGIKLAAPDQETVKSVANEAQKLMDQFGYDQFLKLVKFIDTNPGLVEVGLNLINKR